MTPAEHLVERIRSFSYHSKDAAAALEDLVQDYQTFVEQINERLARCVSLARQGRSSEALHLAELTPPVLKEAAVLDFPGRDQWRSFCLQHGYSSLIEVNFDAAGEVDSLFPTVRKLERLLIKQRRLNVGRAPLIYRLRIQRKLVELDPENEGWEEDLIDLEKTRHRQISQEADAAWADRDSDTLKKLFQECTETQWLAEPSQTMVASIGDHLKRSVAEEGKASMRELEQKIVEAREREDIAAVESLLPQWGKLAARLKVKADAPLPDAISESYKWLRDGKAKPPVPKKEAPPPTPDKFTQDLDALKRELEGGTAQAELQQCWAKVLEHDRHLPDALKRRVDVKLARLKQDRLQRVLIVVIAVLVVLVVIAAVVAIIVTIAALSGGDSEADPSAAAGAMLQLCHVHAACLLSLDLHWGDV